MWYRGMQHNSIRISWLMQWLVVLLYFHSVYALASTSPLLIEQAWLRDAGGSMSLQQVQQSDFVPFTGVLNKGYTSDTYWIRLKVRPDMATESIKLRMRPTFLDDLTFYEPDATSPSEWRKRLAGDSRGAHSGDPGINSTGFVIKPDPPFSTYYLRIQTSSTMLLDVEAMTVVEAEQKDARLAILHFFYFGLTLISMLWGLLEFIQTKQKILLLFCVYQFMNFGYEFSVMGYLSLFEPFPITGFADKLTSMFVMLSLCFATLFHLKFVQSYAPGKKMLYMLFLCQGLLITLPVIYLLGYQRIALQANVTMMMPLSLLMFLLTLTCTREGSPRLRHIRILYLTIFITLILFVLPLLGIITAREWLLQAALLHGLLVTLLSVNALRFRNMAIRHALETSRIELEEQTLHATDQTKFIDMLTHEIKTPLTVATRNLDAINQHNVYSQRIHKALSTIDNIIDRTRLSELFDQKRLIPHSALTNINSLLNNCIVSSTRPQRIHATMPDDMHVHTDPTFLSIIISNLIDNALKYANQDTRITLSVTGGSMSGKSGFYLSVSNLVGASGIPDMHRAFEKYYRNPLAQGKSGSGLGLYLSQKLADMIDCHLTLKTTPTTVELQLWIPEFAIFR